MNFNWLASTKSGTFVFEDFVSFTQFCSEAYDISPLPRGETIYELFLFPPRRKDAGRCCTEKCAAGAWRGVGKGGRNQGSKRKDRWRRERRPRTETDLKKYRSNVKRVVRHAFTYFTFD